MAEEAASGVPLVGSRISLISKKNIRYEGVLYNINTSDASLALQNGEFWACVRVCVQSFGHCAGQREQDPPIECHGYVEECDTHYEIPFTPRCHPQELRIRSHAAGHEKRGWVLVHGRPDTSEAIAINQFCVETTVGSKMWMHSSLTPQHAAPACVLLSKCPVNLLGTVIIPPFCLSSVEPLSQKTTGTWYHMERVYRS